MDLCFLCHFFNIVFLSAPIKPLLKKANNFKNDDPTSLKTTVQRRIGKDIYLYGECRGIT